MKRKIPFIAVSIVLILLGAFMVIPSDRHEPSSNTPPSTTPKPEPTKKKVVFKTNKVQEAPPAPPKIQDNPYAVFAELMGGGWIQCSTDFDFPASYAISGVQHEHVEAGVFRALVSEEAGDQLIKDGEPVAVLHWSGAVDGQQGTCSIGPAKTLHFTGSIKGASTGRLFSPCHPEGFLSITDGQFEVNGVAGASCPILFINAQGSGELVVHSMVSKDNLVLEFVETQTPDTVEGVMEWANNTLDDAEAHLLEPSAFETVMEDPSVSDAVKQQVREWMAEEQNEREDKLDQAEEIQSILEDATKLLNSLDAMAQ